MGRAEERRMYTMKEACEATGLAYETLKFYCNQGLVPHVRRDGNNRRVFSERTVGWIKSLTCLKRCGMSIADIREYLALCLQGPGTIPQRKLMLDRQRELLEGRLRQVQDSLAYIDWKQGFYDDVLAGRTPYVSDLVDEADDAGGDGARPSASRGAAPYDGSSDSAPVPGSFVDGSISPSTEGLLPSATH
jgi:DNA-binding transcriptional MerR regulator